MIIEPAGAEWWKSGKETFHKSFVAHVDERLESGEIADHMPSMQISDDKSPA